MVVDGKEKAVTDNEIMSHPDEHNQNLSNPPPQSKKRNLRIRKLKEADASDSKQTKKKKKTTLGCRQGFGEPDKQCTAAAVVTVESYRVKPKFAATAQYILKRYGDILACTPVKGSMLLAHLLESVCIIYQELEMSEFIDLTLADLEDMSIEVSDFLKINMNVGWLEKKLDNIVNAKKLHQSSTLIEDTMRQTQKVIVELQNELRIKEESMQELQFKIEEIKEKLFSEKTKLETLDQTLTKAKEKVKRFQIKALVDEI